MMSCCVHSENIRKVFSAYSGVFYILYTSYYIHHISKNGVGKPRFLFISILHGHDRQFTFGYSEMYIKMGKFHAVKSFGIILI